MRSLFISKNEDSINFIKWEFINNKELTLKITSMNSIDIKIGVSNIKHGKTELNVF